MKRTVLVIILCLILGGTLFAQDGLTESLQSMLATNAELYLQPLADVFGANMNSALYHRARVHKMLGFDIGIKMMGGMIPDEALTFDWDLGENSFSFDLNDMLAGVPGAPTIDPIELGFGDIYMDSPTETATFFGGDGGVLVVNDDHVSSLFEQHLLDQGVDPSIVAQLGSNIQSEVSNISDFELPGGVDWDQAIPFPMVMPQASLGLPMGIELTVRGLPDQEIPDVGTFSMLGGGLRLNVDQFIPIPLFPVDITAGAFFQQMSIGDLISATNTEVGLQVGKDLNLLIFGIGVYGDIAYASSTLDVTYEYDLDPNDSVAPQEIAFNFDTEPGLRYGAGINLKLIPLTYITAGFSQTPTNQVVNLGLGLSLR